MEHGYLALGNDETWYRHLIIPARFFLLTSVMIPISFKVITDISKYPFANIRELQQSPFSDDRHEEGGRNRNRSCRTRDVSSRLFS
eukprot:gene14358-biopygen16808